MAPGRRPGPPALNTFPRLRTNFLFDLENVTIVRPSCLFGDTLKRFFIGSTRDGLPGTQVRVLHLGSLTLTTDITSSLGPARYNFSCCQLARRLYPWPQLHPNSKPSPCPPTPISR